MGVLAHVVPKTPPRKMCQKPHLEKNRFNWKSQGQIFQECQGQIPRSNPKVKSQGQMGNHKKNRKKPVLIGKIGKMGNGKMGKCNKNEKTKNT